MTSIQRICPEGLVSRPAFSHVAIVPAGATLIYVGGQNAVDADGSLVGEGDVTMESVRARRARRDQRGRRCAAMTVRPSPGRRDR